MNGICIFAFERQRSQPADNSGPVQVDLLGEHLFSRRRAFAMQPQITVRAEKDTIYRVEDQDPPRLGPAHHIAAADDPFVHMCSSYKRFAATSARYVPGEQGELEDSAVHVHILPDAGKVTHGNRHPYGRVYSILHRHTSPLTQLVK